MEDRANVTGIACVPVSVKTLPRCVPESVTFSKPKKRLPVRETFSPSTVPVIVMESRSMLPSGFKMDATSSPVRDDRQESERSVASRPRPDRQRDTRRKYSFDTQSIRARAVILPVLPLGGCGGDPPSNLSENRLPFGPGVHVMLTKTDHTHWKGYHSEFTVAHLPLQDRKLS